MSLTSMKEWLYFKAFFPIENIELSKEIYSCKMCFEIQLPFVMQKVEKTEIFRPKIFRVNAPSTLF